MFPEQRPVVLNV